MCVCVYIDDNRYTDSSFVGIYIYFTRPFRHHYKQYNKFNKRTTIFFIGVINQIYSLGLNRLLSLFYISNQSISILIKTKKESICFIFILKLGSIWLKQKKFFFFSFFNSTFLFIYNVFKFSYHFFY